MSQPAYIKDLLSIAIDLAESLSDRIQKSGPLQYNCKQTVTNLRDWRKKLPSEMDFLLKPTGDKGLYKAILSPLSELLCILCQLVWTAHEIVKPPPSLATISRTNEAEQKIQSASASTKKFMDDLGVWRKPKNGSTPLAPLFDQTRRDKRFYLMQDAINGHLGACYGTLWDLTKKIDRARSRHVGLRLLAGKAS